MTLVSQARFLMWLCAGAAFWLSLYACWWCWKYLRRSWAARAWDRRIQRHEPPARLRWCMVGLGQMSVPAGETVSIFLAPSRRILPVLLSISSSVAEWCDILEIKYGVNSVMFGRELNSPLGAFELDQSWVNVGQQISLRVHNRDSSPHVFDGVLKAILPAQTSEQPDVHISSNP